MKKTRLLKQTGSRGSPGGGRMMHDKRLGIARSDRRASQSGGRGGSRRARAANTTAAFILISHELFDRVRIVDEHLHANERLATLLRQHDPVFGPSEQIAHAALRQAEYALAEQSLRDRVLAEQVFHAFHQLVRVDVRVFVELLL